MTAADERAAVVAFLRAAAAMWKAKADAIDGYDRHRGRMTEWDDAMGHWHALRQAADGITLGRHLEPDGEHRLREQKYP